MNKTIADIFHINQRFLRSTHLERDFSNPDSYKGYISTEFINSCLDRLVKGLQTNSPSRAWRLTGDYGTGKSSFALVLAHLFSGHQNGVCKKLRESLKIGKSCLDELSLTPILVTGNRSPLKIALQSALQKSIDNVTGNSKTKLPTQLQRIVEISNEDMPSRVNYSLFPDELEEIPSIGDADIVEAFVEFSQFVKSKSKRSGILLILDELGKFLEFAAMYPDRQDIYLLQQLAEAASRSGDTPLFVLGLLHQGFNAYYDHLDVTSKQEWEKLPDDLKKSSLINRLSRLSIYCHLLWGYRHKMCLRNTKAKQDLK